ncbi:maleylacetate reductase [Ornithinimicrobium sp. F0845]|uniref:maleylacetate reductase n=1 Tax=Ornithinimicrobium sp. F0845 TaxID=2926412 RepID=UPI001FF31CB3|nr:maleylacetate reductase [Ornithinimicrobium sp. F0845]MCK0114217.1 maleylacetate reductase [Ornithinimicrobium sp. F0845]
MQFVHETLAQRVLLGSGQAATAVAAEVVRLERRRVMLIHGVAEAALAQRVAADLPVTLHWDEVRQHVPLELARRARIAARDAGVDVIVSVGGGSTTGLAKAVALEVDVPIVAVPTTYAGSEATPVWGLTDDGVKSTGVDPTVLPAAVIYDAALTTSLSIDLTVASGLNGLAHCVDSLWAPRADPINLAMALEGARALASGLPAVAAEPEDLEGREQCLYGAYLAALAFASAGSGMHHKICHVLGGGFDLPHAPTHAVVLPYVLAHNAPAVPDLAGRLALALGATQSGVVADPARAAVEALEALCTGLGAPDSLGGIGLAETDLPECAARCLPVIPDSTPVPVTEASLTALLRAAWAGDPPTAPAQSHPEPTKESS